MSLRSYRQYTPKDKYMFESCSIRTVSRPYETVIDRTFDLNHDTGCDLYEGLL
jgi:hypothetical protein